MEQDETLNKIAAELFERVDEAQFVLTAEVEIGEWKPEENNCHINVSTVCAKDPELKPVRGWWYFDLGGILPYVWFNAHSVVQTKDGTLVDITPSKASESYPFLVAKETEEEYDRLLEKYNLVRLTHYK